MTIIRLELSQGTNGLHFAGSHPGQSMLTVKQTAQSTSPSTGLGVQWVEAWSLSGTCWSLSGHFRAISSQGANSFAQRRSRPRAIRKPWETTAIKCLARGSKVRLIAQTPIHYREHELACISVKEGTGAASKRQKIRKTFRVCVKTKNKRILR